jgi:6-pyruvoyltetrahydropterin/6-carboxytetrahydropterin synthase
MVLDFGALKDILITHIHDPFDHGLMLYDQDPILPELQKLPDQKLIIVPFVPTAEQIARHTFEMLSAALGGTNLSVASVLVFETPNCSARFPA